MGMEFAQSARNHTFPKKEEESGSWRKFDIVSPLKSSSLGMETSLPKCSRAGEATRCKPAPPKIGMEM